MKVSPIEAMPTGFVVDALSRMGKDGWIADLAPRGRTARFTARARTLRYAPADQVREPVKKSMYAIMRSLEPGEVLVVATGNAPCWFMGENMIHEALYSRLAGVVTDGRVRDSAELLGIDLPVFSAGISVVPPLDRYAIAELDGPVSVGGASIRKADILHADADGVVCVAQELLAEVERNAAELAEIEAAQERAIRDRVPLEQLQAILALKKGGNLKSIKR
jgi:regulator of RNase E activity RraA